MDAVHAMLLTVLNVHGMKKKTTSVRRLQQSVDRKYSSVDKITGTYQLSPYRLQELRELTKRPLHVMRSEALPFSPADAEPVPES